MLLAISWIPLHFETRLVGVVSDFKLVNMDRDSNIICYVKVSGARDYYVQNKGTIPYIYKGDTLIEYWVNYQKLYIGSTRSTNRYKIIPKDQPCDF